MKSSWVFFSVVLLAVVSFQLHPICFGSGQEISSSVQQQGLRKSYGLYSSLSSFDYHSLEETSATDEKSLAKPSDSSIKEDIPDKYKTKYQEWKKEFLSTEIGRMQWSAFEHNTRFALTITISNENSRGASTGKYKWDDSGKLIAATITLGNDLNEGYPNPIYYPVLNSLLLPEQTREIDGDVLAATKMAHEFGHVNYTAKADPALYQLQGKLIPVYVKIFLSNGRNVDDPRLKDLERQIGGTPVEIWEDREYWGEVNAMLYIRDKMTNNGLRCSIFHKIKQSVNLYAKPYSQRFMEVVQLDNSPNNCGW